jgi:type IV pilus assembly protein PilY1
MFPMTPRRSKPLSVALAVAVASVAPAARAQQAEDPIPPDVLLLLDTSGSMEDLIDDRRQAQLNNPDPNRSAALPTCTYGPNDVTPRGSSPDLPNRWGTAVQSLTGTVKPYFACARTPRDIGSAFDAEYTINGATPYDRGYFIPFHRPVSVSGGVPCVLGPPTTNTYSPLGTWTDSNVYGHVLGARAQPCVFDQNVDGALDRYGELVRFGLMTFDNDPNPGLGSTTAASSWVPSQIYTGAFSYYQGWFTGAPPGSYRVPTDYPATAPASQVAWEVGARHWRAPEWEGRLMGFPEPFAAPGDRVNWSNRVQRVIAAMRPYGGTPIAGMLADAFTFLVNENTTDGDFRSPNADPFRTCRKRYALLITDGGENLDLRGDRNPALPRQGCEAFGGANCPYKRPWDIANDLYRAGVSVVVVGFAVERPTNRTNNAYTCGQLAANQALFDATCSSTNQYTQYLYQPCCQLQKIAKAGQGYAGDARAYFVETAYELDLAIDKILSEISSRAITHTVPVSTGPVVSFNGDTSVLVAGASTYTASLQRLVNRPNIGNLVRRRFDCGVGREVSPDRSKGDDFSSNMATHSRARRFFGSVPADPYNDFVRPFADTSATGDGLGRQASTEIGSTAASIMSGVPWTALGRAPTLDVDPRCANVSQTQRLSPASCAQQALAYFLGEPTSGVSRPDTTFLEFKPRYKDGLDFGAIDHSVPAYVAQPKALIRDPSYQKFAATWATRRPLLYVETTDGLLRAFDTTVNRQETNELWSMIPPAVLPRLRELYPPKEVRIIDGAPIAKDVVWERSSADVAQTEPGWKNWRTMLVAGLGYGGQAGERGYVGVDVTDPDPANYRAFSASATTADLKSRVTADPKGSIGGPHLLWQVGAFGNVPESDPRQVFGRYSATPAITTVLIDSNADGIGDREVGVAILPGGSDVPKPKFLAPCDRITRTHPAQPADSRYSYRLNVRCWSPDVARDSDSTAGLNAKPVAGRSVSIVRLDTGEILRTFMRRADVHPNLFTTTWYTRRVTDTPLDSPMTGQPSVYPADVGAIAQKVFIGDADGTLWRMDLTSPNPDQWKVELFLDTYGNERNVSGVTQYRMSQPIIVQPVVAPMEDGSLMVGVSTGEQESIVATSGVSHYVYALRDDAPSNRAQVSWFQRWTGGERVTGPMAVFDKTFYWATFRPSSASAVCDDTNSLGFIWGHDFVAPANVGDASAGGVPRLQDPQSAGLFPQKIGIDRFGTSSLRGKIVPGVALTLAPTCATFSQAPDAFGRTIGTETFRSASPYVLKAQVAGATASDRSTQAVEVKLASPARRGRVDSWAAVVE